jgi:hypothetical protein
VLGVIKQVRAVEQPCWAIRMPVAWSMRPRVDKACWSWSASLAARQWIRVLARETEAMEPRFAASCSSASVKAWSWRL